VKEDGLVGDRLPSMENTMTNYWLVTAEEGDYVHRRACSTHEKACQQAWRWEDDCLDNIRMEFMCHPALQDDVPF
jgi:hypothetical protein